MAIKDRFKMIGLGIVALGICSCGFFGGSSSSPSLNGNFSVTAKNNLDQDICEINIQVGGTDVSPWSDNLLTTPLRPGGSVVLDGLRETRYTGRAIACDSELIVAINRFEVEGPGTTWNIVVD